MGKPEIVKLIKMNGGNPAQGMELFKLRALANQMRKEGKSIGLALIISRISHADILRNTAENHQKH